MVTRQKTLLVQYILDVHGTVDPDQLGPRSTFLAVDNARKKWISIRNREYGTIVQKLHKYIYVDTNYMSHEETFDT